MKVSSPASQKLLFSLLLLLGICSLAAQKMQLTPYSAKAIPQKKHPYTNQLIEAKQHSSLSKTNRNYEKLLVILVDFQEEVIDDPNTSGRGKFELEPDPSYLYSVGAPPHNRQYYETNLEAMRYYYQAVSAGSYNLEYDVWPKDKTAYTLPHSMGYYNPPNASSAEFIAGMEGYFKDAFETADADDPELVFGDYSHYMIIHAGSDWQHDIVGDTPSDLPSFFIRVGEGKQVSVDGGATEIFHACNVPGTISQDFRQTEENGRIVHSGYGALNAVLFHEFGHSLGLVDLYNVRTFYPVVGSFDIMDSGGAGILVDELQNGDLVMVEGVLPALPGAFSRMLLFEEFYRNNGFMKDIESFDPFTDVQLAASSMKQNGGIKPNLVKIPISPDEYYLIENRSVDPDGDGGTAVFGALDGRVILYPTAFSDPNDNPTYEYDYLLPSFVKADGSAVGGGILAWHVNEKVIYDEGSTQSDGSLWSNFDNNSINTNLSRRGVSVLEADGLQDLGEVYSMYWTGTAYEYFHARKAALDANGSFVRWSFDPWKPRLSAFTDPAMLDSNALGSVYYLDAISDPATLMTFQVKSGFFSDTYTQDFPLGISAAPLINTDYSQVSVPVYGLGGLNLISYLSDEWQDLLGNIPASEVIFSYPLIANDTNNDGFKELIGVRENAMHLMDFSQIVLSDHLITFPTDVSEPMNLGNSVYCHNQSTLYKIKDFAIEAFAEYSDIKKIAGWQNTLVLITASKMQLVDANSLDLLSEHVLPEAFGNYEPIVWDYTQGFQIFLVANSGNIYRYMENDLFRQTVQPIKIFTNPGTDLPSELGAFLDENQGLRLFFGLGNKAYILSTNGYFLGGSPRHLSNIRIAANEHPRALQMPEGLILFLPVQNMGYTAITQSTNDVPQYNMLYSNDGNKRDYLDFDAIHGQLLWYYPTDNHRLFLHSLAMAENPIKWQGYRNNGSGTITGTITGEGMAPPAQLSAYIFPNPVKTKLYRLRLHDAQPEVTVNIYDVSGTKVQSFKATCERYQDIELDASKLASGVYIVHIKSGNGQKTIKFAVEK